jgi:hypothetical protein
MTLVEFNELSFYDKHCFLFSKRTIDIKFNSFRDDENYKYSLWDCGDFFIELVASRAVKGKVVSIEAISLNDKRVDAYIEFMNENWDKEYPLK